MTRQTTPYFTPFLACVCVFFPCLLSPYNPRRVVLADRLLYFSPVIDHWDWRLLIEALTTLTLVYAMAENKSSSNAGSANWAVTVIVVILWYIANICTIMSNRWLLSYVPGFRQPVRFSCLALPRLKRMCIVLHVQLIAFRCRYFSHCATWQRVLSWAWSLRKCTRP